MLTAKSARPNASKPVFHWSALDQAISKPVTLFIAPPGYFSSDSLAKSLFDGERSIIWLRIGVEDRDPATFLLSLIASVRRIRADFEPTTLDWMRRAPGPVFGWPVLYSRLAKEISEIMPPKSAIVLEHLHHLIGNQPTLALLGKDFLPEIPERIPRILISHLPLPSGILLPDTPVIEVDALRIDVQGGIELANRFELDVSNRNIERAINLLQGREVPLAGLFSASRTLGPVVFKNAVNHSANGHQLLGWVARNWLSASSAGDIQALGLAMDLDYCHPRMNQAALGFPVQPSGPWLQDLTDQWSRIWCTWKDPLRSALGMKPFHDPAAICRIAEYLLGQGAVENAVDLYLGAGEMTRAAQVIENTASRMLDLGQWMTMKSWLTQFSDEVLAAWPELIYVRGEIDAANGSIREARRSFSTAANLYVDRQNGDEACKSLLAEATLAAWEDDLVRAQACAISANALARRSGNAWYQAWANWELGCLAAFSDRLDEALIYFRQPGNLVSNPMVDELFEKAKKLVLRQRMMKRQRELHQRATRRLQQSELEAADQLRTIIQTPPSTLPSLLAVHGWKDIPLMIKLASQPPVPEAFDEIPERQGFWKNLLNLLGELFTPGHGQMESRSDDLQEAKSPLPMAPFLPDPYLDGDLEEEESGLLTNSEPEDFLSTFDTQLSLDENQPDKTHINASVVVYSLGIFRLFREDELIEAWTSRKALSILKYLLSENGATVPREVLMDKFWPDSDPEASRRSLHQAIYVLRQTLRIKGDETHYIQFENDGYRLNPEVGLWQDDLQFEKHYKAGQNWEKKGNSEKAAREYYAAESLYQDHYLSEDLYDEWTNSRREYLWQIYLYMVHHLSRHYLDHRDYASAISLAARVLSIDNCQEGAHQVLIRSYLAQGQRQLAIRQYQLCVQALKDELDAQPSVETRDLYQMVLQG